jgi:hypothetical protein
MKQEPVPVFLNAYAPCIIAAPYQGALKVSRDDAMAFFVFIVKKCENMGENSEMLTVVYGKYCNFVNQTL